MDEITRSKIKEHLSAVMKRLIKRRCVTEPFGEQEIFKKNPFGANLVPMEIWKGSKFERSFVTTLGQGIFEQLAKIIAEGTGADAANQHVSRLTICTWRIEKIDSILATQRSNKVQPNWEREVEELLVLNNERFEEVEVVSDLFIRRADEKKEYYSIKTVKPNLDQTERAKRDMLRLLAADKNNEVYFALPYNPAGNGQKYLEGGFSLPYKLFNMDEDKCVLIGSRFWNKVGASSDTFGELLYLFEEVGRQYTPVIKEQYLGI